MDIDKLIKIADTDDWKKRVSVVEELVKMGSPIIPILVLELQNSSWYVRNCVAIALERMKWTPSNEKERALLLIGRLNLKGNSERIVSLGPSVLEFLIPLLRDKSEWVVGKVINCIGMIKDERAIESLEEALQNKDLSLFIKKKIVGALKEIGVDTRQDKYVKIIWSNKKIRAHELAIEWWKSQERENAICDYRGCGRVIERNEGFLCKPRLLSIGTLDNPDLIDFKNIPELLCEKCFDDIGAEPFEKQKRWRKFWK